MGFTFEPQCRASGVSRSELGVGCMYATWFTSPNHALMSVMLVGVGKSVMACMYLSASLTSNGVTVKPANSTVFSAKRNLRGFRVIPFTPQMWSHSVAWLNAPVMSSNQSSASLMHLVFDLTLATRASYLAV